MATETQSMTGELSGTKLTWLTPESVTVGPYRLPCAKGLMNQPNAKAGIRRDAGRRLFLKRLAWPLYSFHSDYLVDGFIRRAIGKWIEELVRNTTVFLEIGCGDMKLEKYVPKNVCYNALDISFSEFHLRRVLKKRRAISVALASATQIPLDSESVDVIAATEVFEHIPEIGTALDEIYRISRPGAKLICSIPNNFCHKYQKKGPHPDHVNYWTYDEYIDFISSHRFALCKTFMKGYWIPLPLWLTKTSYQLPLYSGDEFYCTNFFFQFEAKK